MARFCRGKTTTDMKLHFTQEVEGEVQGKELAFDVTFWELTGTEKSVKPPRPTPKGLGGQVRSANQNQVLDDEKEKIPGNLQEGLETKIAPGDALELQQHRLQMQGNGQICSDVKHSWVGIPYLSRTIFPVSARKREWKEMYETQQTLTDETTMFSVAVWLEV